MCLDCITKMLSLDSNLTLLFKENYPWIFSILTFIFSQQEATDDAKKLKGEENGEEEVEEEEDLEGEEDEDDLAEAEEELDEEAEGEAFHILYTETLEIDVQ